MAIINTDTKRKVSGDGVTREFSFPFKVYKKADITVWLVDKDTDEITEMSLTTHYKVTINRVSEGGTIEFVTLLPPSSDEWVFMFSALEYTQSIVIPVNGVLREVSITNGMDRIVRLIQQVQEQTSRALLQSPLVEAVDATLPAPESLKLIGWNEDADGLENKQALDVDSVEEAKTARDESVVAKDAAVVAKNEAETAAARVPEPETGDAGKVLTVNANEDAYELEKEVLEKTDDKASQAEAEAGTDNEKYMTPLRTKQSIDENVPSGYMNIEVFESSGNFDIPAGVDKVYVELVGGGGGGGGGGSTGSGATNDGAGGGGAGGYSVKICDISEETSPISVTVGTGGSGGGTSGEGGYGISGGETSFGTLFSAGGGERGLNSQHETGGAGGTATAGDININGQSGLSGTYASAGGIKRGGDGGGSYFSGFGGGGRGAYLGFNTHINGAVYGAGGGGGVGDSSYALAGGSGCDGVVIVRY